MSRYGVAAAAIGVLGLTLLVCSTRSDSLAGHRSVLDRGDPASPRSPTLTPPLAGIPTAPVPKRGYRLRMLDVATSAAVPEMEVSLKVPGGTLRMVSDADGVVVSPVSLNEPQAIRLDTPGFELLRIVDDVAWLARVVDVSLLVLLEDPSLLTPRATIKVTVAPLDKQSTAPDGPIPIAADWLQNYRPRQTNLSMKSRDVTFSFRYPALTAVGIAVNAPGHEQAVQQVDMSATRGGPIELTQFLRKARTVRLRVVDDRGQPIQGAVVQVVDDVRGDRDQVNASLERLRGSNTGDAYAIFTKGTEIRAAHIHRQTTSSDGTVEVVVLTTASARTVMVWAAGRTPSRVDLLDSALERQIQIPLRSQYRMCEFYQFTEHGKVVTGGVLYLAEQVDAQLKLTMPAIKGDETGAYSALWIVPDKKYWGLMNLPDGRFVTGWVTFGSEERIALESFRNAPE